MYTSRQELALSPANRRDRHFRRVGDFKGKAMHNPIKQPIEADFEVILVLSLCESEIGLRS